MSNKHPKCIMFKKKYLPLNLNLSLNSVNGGTIHPVLNHNPGVTVSLLLSLCMASIRKFYRPYLQHLSQICFFLSIFVAPILILVTIIFFIDKNNHFNHIFNVSVLSDVRFVIITLYVYNQWEFLTFWQKVLKAHKTVMFFPLIMKIALHSFSLHGHFLPKLLFQKLCCSTMWNLPS